MSANYKRDKIVLDIIKEKFDVLKDSNKGNVDIGILNGEYEVLGLSCEAFESAIAKLDLEGLVKNVEFNDNQVYKHPTLGWVNYYEIPDLYPGDWTMTVPKNFDKKYEKYLRENQKQLKSLLDGKTLLFLSLEGLSTIKEKVEYKFGGVAHGMLAKLHSIGTVMPAKELARYLESDTQVLSTAKKRLNREMKDRLNQEEDLIVNLPRKGYMISNKYYLEKLG